MLRNDKIALFSEMELSVLNYMSTNRGAVKGTVPPPDSSLMVNEISQNTGIRDNDEVLRALYTLEGKQLVQPDPAWDFTSNRWKITDVGVRAVEVLKAA